MKKTIILLVFLSLSFTVFSQQYDTDKLKIISTIWGETYLFHPAIIKSDINIEWEKQLVDFLPQIKKQMTTNEFIDILNSRLLSKLQDPFTLAQNTDNENITQNNIIKTNNAFEYLKISEKQLSDISSLKTINDAITNRTSNMPIVIDLRINNKLLIDWHTNTFFDYFASMIIDKPIPLSLTVSREHFGWDEYNDWWYYEQRWKVANIDKQLIDNGQLKPFSEYSQELQQYLPDFDFGDFNSINRPVCFITNNTFLSYYASLLIALKANRDNTFIINDNSGKIYTPDNSNLTSCKFNDFEFILNSSFYLNNGITEMPYDINTPTVSSEKIIELINSRPDSLNISPFTFEISPKKYISTNQNLSVEEKILGIIKVWTIVKYFYVHQDLCSDNWENLLDKYLELAQNTSSDKEYYTLIQEMTATLNDSHVSTYHSSILDFSKTFIAPVKFEWIEEKVIITAIDNTINANISIGDEIVSIDGLLINEILENEKKKISSSNHQGLLATVINPGYFIGASGSIMKLDVRKGKKSRNIEIQRTTYIFQFMNFGDDREASKILEHNIGYLNLALLTNTSDLENELVKMQNTDALIIDLRSSYPTSDYHHFLQMLCIKETTVRIDEVPIVSANMLNKKLIKTSEYKISPDTSFTYNKPIAVLIDKSMISRPEDIAIALKAFPNVTFVGEQTQGTDGEMTKIHLPIDGETSFTGQVVKFGNGDNFQSIGIIPDVKVIKTIEGVKNNKDEIFEKAIEIMNE